MTIRQGRAVSRTHPAGKAAPVRPRGEVESTAQPATIAVDAPVQVLLLVIATAVFLTVLTGSMVNVLISPIRTDLGASTAQAGWIVTAYALAYAIGVPLYGKISDIVGVRRIFTLGLLGFIAGGVICAVAPSFAVLILGRLIQGLGGSAVPALSTITVAKVLPPGQRGSALGLMASSVGIGSAVGPIAGGAIGEALGWRALFAGSVVLMAALIPFARKVLPDAVPGADRSFDLAGGVLLGLSAGLFLFGITQAQVESLASITSWGSFLGAGIAAVGFLWRINTASRPFVPPELFRNRPYVAAMVVGFFAMLANMAVLVFVPLLVVEENGLSTSEAGLVLTPGAIVLAALAPVAGRLSDRLGVRPPLVAGLAAMAIGFAILSTLAGASPYLIAGGTAVVAAGFSCIQSPANNAAANTLRAEDLGSGMGLFTGVFFLGGGTGPALIGALLAAREEAESTAINPFYSFDAAPFSDIFLAVTVVVSLALAATAGLRSGAHSDGNPTPDESENARGESA